MNGTARTYLLPGLALTVAVLLLTALFPPSIQWGDDALVALGYRVRGEAPTDSSIVILYFSNDDLAALGTPLRRSYYALLVDVLDDLGARAVGIDIAFTSHDNAHPEYDDLLAAMLGKAGNVVLGGYFRDVVAPSRGGGTAAPPLLPQRYSYPLAEGEQFLAGSQPEFPLKEFIAPAAAVGHTNVNDDLTIPLFLRSGDALIPAFALELLRLGLDAERSNMKILPGAVEVSAPGVHRTIPLVGNGSLAINFAGGVGSLHTLSAVAFLKAYDSLNAGLITAGSASFPDLRKKIVLVGIIAEGRSAFVPTPFDERFPSIGLHAMVLHNALQGTFLTRTHWGVPVLVALALGMLCAFIMSRLTIPVALFSIAGLVVVLLLLSYVLFTAGTILPLGQALLVAVLVAAAMLGIKQKEVHRQVESLTAEKSTIERRLEEKETILQSLEEELREAQAEERSNRSSALRGEIERYRNEIQSLKAQSDDLEPFSAEAAAGSTDGGDFHGILYARGSAMAEVVAFIKKIAPNDAGVLVLGESGTGKELVARAIHNESRRAAKPFVAVNCGALSETLLESELFGHEKGAFTGAVRERPGRFQLAHDGTIFLDEIAETSEAFQVKLLRVLQEGTFERVGGSETISVDVRVIAATNRDVTQLVKEKKFREDLYYRLNIFTIHLPPLRSRAEDIPLLAGRFAAAEAPGGVTVSAGVMKLLCEHPWKGNVRELQSVMKRAVLLARSDGRDIVRLKDIPEEIASAAPSSLDLEEQILQSLREKQFARRAISETADEMGGLNRGTVAEYVRGMCFKTYSEQQWNLPAAASALAGTAGPETCERARKKISEYLRNAIELVDRAKPLEEVLAVSKPKYKNLPQRYHRFLDEIISSYYRGEWAIEEKEG